MLRCFEGGGRGHESIHGGGLCKAGKGKSINSLQSFQKGAHLDFKSSETYYQMSDPQNYKIINLCHFKSLTL